MLCLWQHGTWSELVLWKKSIWCCTIPKGIRFRGIRGWLDLSGRGWTTSANFRIMFGLPALSRHTIAFRDVSTKVPTLCCSPRLAASFWYRASVALVKCSSLNCSANSMINWMVSLSFSTHLFTPSIAILIGSKSGLVDGKLNFLVASANGVLERTFTTLDLTDVAEWRGKSTLKLIGLLHAKLLT